MDPYAPRPQQPPPPPPLRLGPLTPGELVARDILLGATVAYVVWFVLGAPGSGYIADALGWGD